MENLKKKLNSHAGESLSETLVSLLIATLALVMLAGAMTSAFNSVTKSKEKLEGENGYYSQIESLAIMDSETKTGTMTMNISSEGLELVQSVDVNYYVYEASGNTPIIAYKSK